MTWNSRSVRIKRVDKLLKTRHRRAIVGGGGACPAITLGDLDWRFADTPYFILDSGDQYAAIPITGGVAPYSLSVSGGALPTGTTLTLDGSDWLIDGTPTEFGSFTFTIGGTDANGCAITPREYTVEVWAQFQIINQLFDNGTNFYIIPVTGINTTYGSTNLVSLEFNITLADVSQVTTIGLLNPDSSIALLLSPTVPLAGSNLTGAAFYNHNITDYPFITTGTAPYTGNWKDYDETSGISDSYDLNYDGQNNIGDWTIVIANSGPAGTLESAILTFKPI